MRKLREWIAEHDFSVAGLLAAAAVLAFFKIRSTDIFWHLASGRWIFENGALPRTDPFRFTSEGAAWVDHEWLFQVLVHGCERIAGLDSLIVLRVLLVVSMALLLYRTGRRTGLPAHAATVLAAVSLFGTRPRMLLRPELFSFVALLVLVELLDRLRSTPPETSWRPVAAMAGLTLVWVNLHGMAILSPVIAVLYLAGGLLLPKPSRTSLPRLLGVPAALFATLLLNPYGYHVLLVSSGISSAMRGLPGTNAEWAPQWLAPQAYFFFGVAATAGLAIVARLRNLRLDGPTGLLALGLTLLAVTAVRHQALFFIGVTPFAARTLARLLTSEPLPRAFAPLARAAALVTCTLIVLWTLFPPTEGVLRPRQGAFTPGFGIEPRRFPEAAGDFLEQHPDIGPLYNTFAHGGYLIWRFHPPRQVFHDGRMELEPTLLREIGEARENAHAWEELMQRYEVDGALVRYEERPRPVLDVDEDGRLRLAGYRTPSALLFPRSLYSLIYWDDVAMLLVRRRPDRATWLDINEYSHLDPEDLEWTLRRAAEDHDFAAAALLETGRRLSEDPDSRRARWLQDELLRIRLTRPENEHPVPFQPWENESSP